MKKGQARQQTNRSAYWTGLEEGGLCSMEAEVLKDSRP